MSIDPWHILDEASTVLAVHAHPDDESLSTGALLASLAGSGTRVELVTATRGEEGEVVPGSVDSADTRPLELIREAEIDTATAILGLTTRYMLGEAPALAAGAAPRVYRDSGMQWVREGLAGPSDSAGPESFTHRPLQDAVNDLAALIKHVRPDVVIGYDDGGTYGHPDHVHAHHVTAAACARTGTVMIEVASAPDIPEITEITETPETSSTAGTDGSGFVWRGHPGTADIVRRAVDSYRTQLTVVGWVGADTGSGDGTGTGTGNGNGNGNEGIRIRHVGGQDDVVALRTGLRVRE